MEKVGSVRKAQLELLKNVWEYAPVTHRSRPRPGEDYPCSRAYAHGRAKTTYNIFIAGHFLESCVGMTFSVLDGMSTGLSIYLGGPRYGQEGISHRAMQLYHTSSSKDIIYHPRCAPIRLVFRVSAVATMLP